MWSEGDTVLWRSASFGHVGFAMPHRLVALSAEAVVLWVPPGAQDKRFGGRPLSTASSGARAVSDTVTASARDGEKHAALQALRVGASARRA